MDKILLWDSFPHKIPENNQVPYLEFFPCLLQQAPAVVLVPGGGYGGVCKEHEGRQVALWLNSIGYSVFMLTYRVAPYRAPIQLEDISRAIRYVRYHANEYNINAERIGAMGFSAGGHLVASLAVRFDNGTDGDEIDKMPSKPDFAALIYPVISTNPDHLNTATFRNLLGDKQNDPDALHQWALENHIREDMPPIFMVHAMDDTCVGIQNSIAFATACHKKNVPFEYHVYPDGGHGFGICNNNKHTATWRNACKNWLEAVTNRNGRSLKS